MRRADQLTQRLSPRRSVHIPGAMRWSDRRGQTATLVGDMAQVRVLINHSARAHRQKRPIEGLSGKRLI
jgi:hypothetical protein